MSVKTRGLKHDPSKGRDTGVPRTVMALMEPGVRSNCCDENFLLKSYLDSRFSSLKAVAFFRRYSKAKPVSKPSGIFALITAIVLWWLKFSRRGLRKYLSEVDKQHGLLNMIDLEREIRLEDIYVTLKMAKKVQKPEMPGMEDDRGDEMVRLMTLLFGRCVRVWVNRSIGQ